MPHPPQTFAKTRRAFNDPVSAMKQHPRFIAPPLSNLLNLNLPLEIALPGAERHIKEAGQLVFHTVGDTGGIHGTEVQDPLAELMEKQISGVGSADKPLFFYHLGDVVYFNGMSNHYEEQFYEPYKYYDAPIFAIPGNHDGDTSTRPGDEKDTESTLFGFMQNFCALRRQHFSPYRETMTQPYVWWVLETPLLNFVGLYSNVDGSLDPAGAFEQQKFLEDQLSAMSPARPFVITVHHSPYSLDTAHGGYPAIGESLDRAMNITGRLPVAVLSGHVHNYQRFRRALKKGEVEYIVAGSGGYAHNAMSLHKLQKNPAGGRVKAPMPTTHADVTLQAFNDTEPGFLRIRVNKTSLSGEFFTVDFSGNPTGISDTFKLKL